MVRVFDDGAPVVPQSESVAQPFLLEPIAGVSDYGCAEDEFIVTSWSPQAAHTLECPTASPLVRKKVDGQNVYFCRDCEWVHAA